MVLLTFAIIEAIDNTRTLREYSNRNLKKDLSDAYYCEYHEGIEICFLAYLLPKNHLPNHLWWFVHVIYPRIVRIYIHLLRIYIHIVRIYIHFVRIYLHIVCVGC